MKHLLFAGHNFYPKGGISDLVAIGELEDLQAHFLVNAKEIANGASIDNWGQIVKAETLECVLWGELGHVGSDPMSPGIAIWCDTPPYDA